METAIGSTGVRKMAVIAMMTAVLCILCPFSLPVGPVPVTLGVFAVFLSAFCLPPAEAVTACALYLLLGLTGLPVFAGYTAGPARLFGPTGGYLTGYLFLAFLTSLFVRIAGRNVPEGTLFARRILLQTAGMVLGLFACYFFGTAWFCIQNKMAVAEALAICVLPFLVFDAGKIAAALLCGNALRSALRRARLL